MCGRFALRTSTPELARLLGLEPAIELAVEPRYNIAPTQPVLACRASRGARELVALRWGLVPAWSRDPSAAYRMINARAEGISGKPAFRAALRRRRCLVPADAFYEWQKLGARKQPWCIARRDGAPFCFAGLWETWEGAAGYLESCTIVTTEANELLAPLHARMPVILDPEEFEHWLDPSVQEPARITPLLRPYPAADMHAWPVSTLVNSPRNDDPRCVEAIAPSADGA